MFDTNAKKKKKKSLEFSKSKVGNPCGRRKRSTILSAAKTLIWGIFSNEGGFSSVVLILFNVIYDNIARVSFFGYL